MKAYIKFHELFLNWKPKTKIQKTLMFPLTRIIIAFLFLVPAIILNNGFMTLLDNIENPLLTIIQIVKAAVLIALLIFLYRKYTFYIEKREAKELSILGWFKEFGTGSLIGGGMVIFIVMLLLISGSYTIDHINSPFLLINRIFRYAQGSFIEDLIFTIIVFRLLEELSGTVIAYLLTTLLFGGLHLFNDNATIANSLFISIIQITFLAPFILTRRIWMTWAVHLSWNFFQAGVFGMNNSGMGSEGFIAPIISGPEWFTGGMFGIEGSITSLVVNLAIGIPILIYAYRENQIVPMKNKMKHSKMKPDNKIL